MKQPKIDIVIRFNPELTIIVAGETIGRIGFKDIEDMKNFIEKLKKSIEVLVKEFRNKEKKIVETK